MKKIKSILNRLKIEMDSMMEYLNQIAYIGFILSAILILFNTVSNNHAIIYTISLIIHLLILAFFGYQKFWDYMSDNNVPTISFVFCTLILIGITAIFTSTWITLLLYFSIFLAGAIYIFFTERLICTTCYKKQPVFEIIFQKHPIFWYLLLLIIPIIAIIIPLAFSSFNIVIKIVIVLIYIISMPLIAMAADNGFDLKVMFNM